MNTAYLALGSNQGNREQALEKALTRIEETCGYVTQASSVYETAAWGLELQPDFLNMVVCINSGFAAEKLLQLIQKIENELHRKRAVTWGPRTIDIDILFYNADIINTPDLVVPHPRLQDRRFVLVPLVEIAPDLVHPLLHKTTTELLEICPDKLEVSKRTK